MNFKLISKRTSTTWYNDNPIVEYTLVFQYDNKSDIPQNLKFVVSEDDYNKYSLGGVYSL